MSESDEHGRREEADDERLIGGAMQPVPATARRVARPIVEALGLVLVGVEVAREGARSVLWIYVDRPEGGVTIDDCARVSPEVSAALDVDDPVPEAYELRISSPGLDRPLMSAGDFRRHAGRPAVVQLSEPLGGRKRFTGEIGEVGPEGVELRCADGTHVVPLESIHRARIKYEVPQGAPKRKP